MERKSVTYDGKIIKDFSKEMEKKALKKQNAYLSFAMKSIARDQEKNMLISHLQTDLKIAEEKISLLTIENEVKENLLKSKENQLESLEQENKKLYSMLHREKSCAKEKELSCNKEKETSRNKIKEMPKEKTKKVPDKSYNNDNKENIAPKVTRTSSNVALIVNNFETSFNADMSKSTESKAEPKDSKKKSIKAVTNAMGVGYNLRKRSWSCNYKI